MNNEIWKPVLDYIGLYEVSNLGRVRSLKFNKFRILKPFKTKKGYLHVDLCKDGKRKAFNIHRLVWETFNGKIPDGMQVNHINEDKTDNFVFVNPDGSVDLDKSNLNLMTPKENTNYGTRNKRVSVAMTNGKLSDPVLQLTLDGELVREWPSMSEADRYGYNSSHISSCCNGKRKSHKGFKWMKKLPSC